MVSYEEDQEFRQMHEKLFPKQHSYTAEQEETREHMREFHSAHWLVSLKEKFK